MKKLIRRLVFTIFSLIVLAVLALAAFVAFDVRQGETSASLTNTGYMGADSADLRGYLALPDGPGPHPAVLLIHEWWGLNEGMIPLADALAEKGYVVLAADAYRGKTTTQVPTALWWTLTKSDEEISSDVEGALEFLLAHDAVDPDRIASMGFCFGGGQSLQLGMRRSQSVALTLIYYGSLVTEPALLTPLQEGRGVLGVFGEDDRSIPVDGVLEFESALNSLGVPNEVTVYPGVGHAFLNESNFEQPGTAGDAWQQALAFLEANL